MNCLHQACPKCHGSFVNEEGKPCIHAFQCGCRNHQHAVEEEQPLVNDGIVIMTSGFVDISKGWMIRDSQQ